ncbi:hypothetical protein GALL_417180 [mine drainage metagenome]|uniref:Uncharacterized protein n=1 Tax=mine drainage metagenome TaxID=410659 RepID=A0A1J5PZU7_9ZZZZ
MAHQEAPLRVGLDAFGDDRQPQRLRHRDDGLRDQRVLASVGQAVDEGLVDFQLIDRQARQVRQRRAAGAEVVKRERDPGQLERLHLAQRVVDVVEHDALGQLELEPGGVGAGRVDRAQHAVDETGVGELPRADVDREHALARRRPLAPRRNARAGGVEHPLAELDDQAGLLGHRDELTRREQAAHRVVPAQQGLGPDDGARAVELRLVVQLELAELDGLAQLRLQRGAPGQLDLHALFEEAQRIASVLLGAIHREVGVHQDRLGGVGAADEQRRA